LLDHEYSRYTLFGAFGGNVVARGGNAPTGIPRLRGHDGRLVGSDGGLALCFGHLS
jgi:hypothetical protein